MHEQQNEKQRGDEQTIPFHAIRGSQSLSNFHDVDDEDDVSTGKEKTCPRPREEDGDSARKRPRTAAAV